MKMPSCRPQRAAHSCAEAQRRPKTYFSCWMRPRPHWRREFAREGFGPRRPAPGRGRAGMRARRARARQTRERRSRQADAGRRPAGSTAECTPCSATALPATVPEQFSPPQKAYASFPQADATAPIKPSACQLRLAKVATFKSVPVLIGAGECGATDAIVLDGVMLADRAKVVISPPATLRCTTAEEVAAWLRDDIAPAVLKLGAPLRGLDNFDSYECRGRNRVRGATLSEHGRAN